MMKEVMVMIHHPSLSTNDDGTETDNSANSGSGTNHHEPETGNVYTEGMYRLGLPELLVQDVPRRLTHMVLQTLRRLVDRLRTGHRLYTGTRIVDDDYHCYFFRVIEVQHDAYRVHLLTHVMTQWNCVGGRSCSSSGVDRQQPHCCWMEDALLRSVAIMVLTPWFIEDMEEWATLPRPPLDRYDCRDKIFLTALLGEDCRGRPRRLSHDSRVNAPSSIATDHQGSSVDELDDVNGNEFLFSESDATYFLEHTNYFLRLLDVTNTSAFLYRMPPSFQRMTMSLGNRMTTTTTAAATTTTTTTRSTGRASNISRYPLLGARNSTRRMGLPVVFDRHAASNALSPPSTYIRARCPRVGVRRAAFHAPRLGGDYRRAAATFSPGSPGSK